MNIILDYIPNFSSNNFRQTLLTNKTTLDYSLIEEFKATRNVAFENSGKDISLGFLINEDDNSQKWSTIVQTCFNRYAIKIDNVLQKYIELVVPTSVVFTIEVKVVLLVNTNLEDTQKEWLVTIYEGFDNEKDTFLGYIYKHYQEMITRGITEDDFAIICYGEIVQDKIVESQDQVDYYYSIDPEGDVDLRNLKLVKVDEDCSEQFPVEKQFRRQSDDFFELDANLEGIATQNAPSECTLNDKFSPAKVTNLFEFPEFKVVWRKKVVKVGCSRVTMDLPQLMTRSKIMELYRQAYFDNREYVGAVLEAAEDCLKKSAAYSLVVLVVVQNPPAAVSIFRALFEQCMKSKGLNYLCLVPELMVKTRKTRWRRVS